jgi:multidrug efflux pump subunit AcrB
MDQCDSIGVTHNGAVEVDHRKGEFGALQDAKQRLVVIVPLSLVLILALLYALFNSVRDSFIALSGMQGPGDRLARGRI